MKTPVVVLLSGGLDSATVLALAVAAGHACHALSFDYGQRHAAELDAARRVAAAHGAATHRVLRIDFGAFGGSALTDSGMAVPAAGGEGIPVTYVPARNSVFLSCGLALAEVLGARDIHIGVNAIDSPGYPDCRAEFIAAFEALANLGTRAGVEGDKFRVRAPLLALTKARIIETGTRLGVDYAMTISCYRADGEGRACGRCDACAYRKRGFAEAGVEDPTRYY